MPPTTLVPPPRRMSPAARRYNLRFSVLLTIYLTLLGGMIWLFATYRLEPPITYLVAVLPALPLVGIVAAVGLYLKEETDEFGRLIIVTTMLWGLAGTLVVTTVLGFLESAGGPRLPLYWVFPMFGGFMTLALPYVAWRYR